MTAALLSAALAGCVTSEVKLPHEVALNSAEAVYPEEALLSVGVVIFDSGIPEGELTRDLREELLRDGTWINIRRSEAIMMADTLADTIQRSGYFGPVWVTPRDTTAVDVTVRCGILESDGAFLELECTARDGTGEVWIDNTYEMETAAAAYNRQRYPTLDPYQDVYNSIANDLAAARASLPAAQVADVRTVAELRYASELSPEAFGGYLEENRGLYEPVRLPAAGDPTLDRTRAVRQREQLFIETLDQHYDDFAFRALESYDGWRESSREDSIRIREAAKAAKVRTAMGALTILTAIAYGRNSDSNGIIDRAITDAGIYIGMDLIQSSRVRRQERRLHQQALQELSESFEDSVEPLVVEVRGTQHRLSGTLDAQYEDWRALIQDLYLSETGFVPEDIEMYAEPDTAPESGAAPEASGASGAVSGAAPESEAASEAGAAPEAALQEASAESGAAADSAADTAAEEASSDANGGQVTGA